MCVACCRDDMHSRRLIKSKHIPARTSPHMMQMMLIGWSLIIVYVLMRGIPLSEYTVTQKQGCVSSRQTQSLTSRGSLRMEYDPNPMLRHKAPSVQTEPSKALVHFEDVPRELLRNASHVITSFNFCYIHALVGRKVVLLQFEGCCEPGLIQGLQSDRAARSSVRGDVLYLRKALEGLQ